MEDAINGVRFQHCYLNVMLTRGHRQWNEECIRSSRQMLRLLGKFEPDWDEAFNGIGVTWQMLYSPFTPFFVLYRKLLSDARSAPAEAWKDLEAMECLTKFLKTMRTRHRQADRLDRICSTFTQHARNLLEPDRVSAKQTAPGTATEAQPLQAIKRSDQLQDMLEHAAMPATEIKAANGHEAFGSAAQYPYGTQLGGSVSFDDGFGADALPTEMELDQLLAWMPQQDSIGEASFDWLAWDSQMT